VHIAHLMHAPGPVCTSVARGVEHVPAKGELTVPWHEDLARVEAENVDL
jgi:hypothetical protein